MSAKYRTVGWGGSGTCACGNPPCAIVEPVFETPVQGIESGYADSKKVCKVCLSHLNVAEDKIAEVLEGLAL